MGQRNQIKFSVAIVQSLIHIWTLAIPWTAAQQASLSSSICQSLLMFVSIELVMLSNHFILCRSLLLLPSIFPSIRVFANELVLCIRWPKYWSFSLSISPSNDYSGLISFKIDWFWSLCSSRDSQESSPTPPFKSINFSALSFLYSPTLTSIHDYWKTIALTRWTLVGKVMSLLFNMLSRLVITFLPRSNHHLQWFWSPEK